MGAQVNKVAVVEREASFRMQGVGVVGVGVVCDVNEIV
jgi:hypothetical protein